MRTPREILLGQHRNIEPRLGALREQFVAELSRSPARGYSSVNGDSNSNRFGWRDLLLMVRWHLACLAAIWLFIAVLSITSRRGDAESIAQNNTASPRTVILTLRENRRQIEEFGDAATFPGPAVLPSSPPSRRSHVQTDWAYS